MQNINRNQLVEQWLQSGQSQKHFSAFHNIKLSTFMYWVKKYRMEKQQENGFARVDLSDQVLNYNKARIEISLADDLIIRIF